MFTNGLDRLFTNQNAIRRERDQQVLQEELSESCRILARELAMTVLKNPGLGEGILADDRVTDLIQQMAKLEALGNLEPIEQILAMLPLVVRSHLEIIFTSNS